MSSTGFEPAMTPINCWYEILDRVFSKNEAVNRMRELSIKDGKTNIPFIDYQGRMAEWSKALVLGTSHFGGAGSNPVPVSMCTCAGLYGRSLCPVSITKESKTVRIHSSNKIDFPIHHTHTLATLQSSLLDTPTPSRFKHSTSVLLPFQLHWLLSFVKHIYFDLCVKTYTLKDDLEMTSLNKVIKNKDCYCVVQTCETERYPTHWQYSFYNEFCFTLISSYPSRAF